ncbi:MAG: hypothetical protein HZB72_09045 [Burkholderiales bacterium]|nr:hypothetical protein [Burkholderiales bacterium]
MARQPAPARQETTELIELDAAALTHASQALDHLSEEARAVMAAYELPSADPNQLELQIRGFQQTAVEAMFQVGARLMLLRKVTEHGDWLLRLERLGLSDTTARRMVNATLKYADPKKPRSDRLLSLDKSKLIELMVLDDEQLDVLDQGGQVGQMDLDDVERMSFRELRAELRKARAQVQAKDKVIQVKENKIATLAEAVDAASTYHPAPNTVAATAREQAQLDELQAATLEAEQALLRLVNVATDVLVNDPAGEAVQERARNDVAYLCQRLADLTTDAGIEVDLEERLVPSWQREIQAEAAQAGGRGKGRQA